MDSLGRFSAILALGPVLWHVNVAQATPRLADGSTPLRIFEQNVEAGGEFVPGELRVRGESVDQDPEALRAGAAPSGCVFRRQMGRRPLYLFDCPTSTPMGEIIEVWQRVDGIGWVEPSFYEEPCATPDDLSSDQWHHYNYGQTIDGSAGSSGADISSLNAWDVTTGSSSLVIAVIDTGVYADHEDLSSQMWENTAEDCSNGVDDDGNGYVDDCYGWDVGDADSDPDPTTLPAKTSSGGTCKAHHGTFIAGLAGAEGDNSVGLAGVNWDVSIMNLKKHPDATCSTTSTQSVEAINYAVDNGADVLNLSFSSSSYSADFEASLQDADAAGIITVIAAANDGDDLDSTTLYPAYYSCTNAIVVASCVSG